MATRTRKPFTPILKLNKNSIDWKIAVRVIRKYRVPADGVVQETVELLLQDFDGTRVQATIKSFLIDKFDRLLNEGELIFVQKFSVVDRPRSYPITALPYKIVFQHDTFFGPHVNRRFDRSVFQFRSIPDIKTSAHRDDMPLFDVIGHIVSVDSKRMALDIPNKSVQFAIEDLDKNRLVCVLWAPYCFEFERYREHFMKEGRRYGVIVQLCRTKVLRSGEVGVSNTDHTTKVILNQHLDDIVYFLGRLPVDEAGINFDGSHISVSSGMSVSEELDSPGAVYMTIAAMKESIVTQNVWIVASISEVLFDRDWSYTSCNKCKKRVQCKDDKLFCDNCQAYVVGNSRYKVFINVVNGTGSAVFLMGDEVARELIGKEAAVVIEQTMLDNFAHDGKVSEAGRIEEPKDVDALTGPEVMFRVTIEHKHITGSDDVYTVDKISTDWAQLSKYRQTRHLPAGAPGGHSQGNQGETSWDGSGPVGNEDDDFKSPDTKSGKRKLDEVSVADDDVEITPSISSTKVKVAAKVDMTQNAHVSSSQE